jgi:hypothetical protein
MENSYIIPKNYTTHIIEKVLIIRFKLKNIELFP